MSDNSLEKIRFEANEPSQKYKTKAYMDNLCYKFSVFSNNLRQGLELQAIFFFTV